MQTVAMGVVTKYGCCLCQLANALLAGEVPGKWCLGRYLCLLFPSNWQVNGMLLAGQKVYVGPFLKKSDRPVDKESRFTNVYVKNLPDSVDDKKLNEMFSEHGTVTSAVVMKVFL